MTADTKKQDHVAAKEWANYTLNDNNSKQRILAHAYLDLSERHRRLEELTNVALNKSFCQSTLEALRAALKEE